jgi:hypothetical protein
MAGLTLGGGCDVSRGGMDMPPVNAGVLGVTVGRRRSGAPPAAPAASR